MDPFENKTAHLADIARAHVADASELNEIAELLRKELLARAEKIQGLKDLCDERLRETKTEASKAFRFGFILGFGVPALIATAFRILGI